MLMVENPMTRQALEALQRRTGGTIVGDQLVPNGHNAQGRTLPELKSITNVLSAMIEQLPDELHSLKKWMVAATEPQLERTAIDWLKREGFEAYYPTYRQAKRLPLRRIPPKKRHLSHLYVRETVLMLIPGYVFFRRLWGHFDVNRLFDLPGCGSVLKMDNNLLTIADHDIELMRLAEADGRFDAGELYSPGPYKVTRNPDDQRWTGTSKLIGRLDDSDKTVLFVERYGRITSLISRASP